MLAVPLSLPDAEILFYPSFLETLEGDRLFSELMQTITWRHEAITLYGRSQLQPRLTAWYGDAGKSYRYSGLTMHPIPWTPLLLDLKEKVEGVSGVRFNSALLNLYRDGQDSMGWHSDDEPELGCNPVIGSLSLGGTRRFRLRHRREPAQKQELALTSGSFLLMRGTTQHNWQH
jgi:alkylated DNA repair dioxygenase AlkB